MCPLTSGKESSDTSPDLWANSRNLGTAGRVGNEANAHLSWVQLGELGMKLNAHLSWVQLGELGMKLNAHLSWVQLGELGMKLTYLIPLWSMLGLQVVL